VRIEHARITDSPLGRLFFNHLESQPAIMFFRQGYSSANRLQDYNLFSLTTALSFAGVYAAILLIARAAQEYFGARGMYVAAALAGLADVDAVTIAFTRLGPEMGGWQAPAAAVTIAVVTNTRWSNSVLP
jgi:uncharacterized membrane protein (DUF4010 family)